MNVDESQSEAAPSGALPQAAPRVLIVDDERAISAPTAAYFRSLGCVTDVAAEPEEAGALVAHRHYDLAILDVRLTRWSSAEGLDVLREIRQRDAGTIVVVLGAHVDDDTEREARRRGADLVLRKPLPLPTLAGMAFRLMGFAR